MASPPPTTASCFAYFPMLPDETFEASIPSNATGSTQADAGPMGGQTR
jgi:hypothetical protein